MYVQNERVCHGVSYRFWAKMWHPEDPPPRLLEAQKNTWGGYISGGQVKYFSEISCLTPPRKIPGLKGGEIACYERKSIIISVGYCMSISKHCNQTKLGTQVFENTTHGRCCQHGYSRQPVAITPFFSVTIPHGGKLKSPMTNRRTTAQSPEISISTYRHQKKHQNCRKW